MQLMSMCDNLVIANSSFSWWAAWLNSKPYKRIIAPKQWFANHMISDSHLVPSCWERI
ncbi:MAG TPA: hypothetical protein DEQ23_01050 [Chlorobium sp.]|nr:hypothetical protein [Chlorobium sp.]